MSRTFEQIINSMSDIEFDRLIDSVKELREVSTPVNKYFEQVDHFMEFSDEYRVFSRDHHWSIEISTRTHIDFGVIAKEPQRGDTPA